MYFLKIPKNQFKKKMYFLKNSKKIERIIFTKSLEKKVSQGKTLKYHLKCGKSAAA